MLHLNGDVGDNEVELWAECSLFYLFMGKDSHWFACLTSIPLSCSTMTQPSFQEPSLPHSQFIWFMSGWFHLPFSLPPSFRTVDKIQVWPDLGSMSPSVFFLVQGGYGNNPAFEGVKLKTSFISFRILGNCRCAKMNYTTGKIKLKAAACVYKTAAANYRYL